MISIWQIQYPTFQTTSNADAKDTNNAKGETTWLQNPDFVWTTLCHISESV